MRSRLLFILKYAIFWLALFVLLRLLFVLVNYEDLGLTVSRDEFFKIFLYGAKLDISATAYILLFPVLLLAVSPFFSRFTKRIIAAYTAVVVFAAVLLSIIDLRFYKYLGYRLDITPVRHLSKPGVAVNASLTIGDFFIPVIAAVLLFFICRKMYQRISRPLNSLNGGGISITAVFLLLLAALIIPMRGGLGQAPIGIGSVYFSQNLYANHCCINIPWNVAYSLTITDDFTSRYHFMEDTERQRLMDTLFPKKRETRSVLKTERPNVLVIIVESFTGKLIGLQREGKEITPHLNALRHEGIFFPHFYASGDRTNKGLPATLSGYPAQPLSTIINHTKKMESLPGLFSEVKKAGYETYFYYGGDIDFSNFRSYVVKGGAEHVITQNNFPSSVTGTKWGAPDGIVLDSVARQMQSAPQPFFTAVLTLSSHEPFEVPTEPLLSGSDNETHFLNACHYTDKALGDFISTLKATPLWDNLLIVMTADHGHNLPGFTPLNVPERFRTFLLLLGGALTEHGEITLPASQTDIAETISRQLNIASDFPFSKDLFDKNSVPFAFYCFNDGFGFLTEHSILVYDHSAGNFMLKEGTPTPTDEATGKAFLQTVIEDFSKR